MLYHKLQYFCQAKDALSRHYIKKVYLQIRAVAEKIICLFSLARVRPVENHGFDADRGAADP